MPPNAARASLLANGKARSSVKIGISGHQRIPPSALPFIEKGVREILTSAGPDLLGISSLAVGADQLFAREILALGGALHVVVPSAGYESTFSEDERISYESFLSCAKTVEALAHSAPSEDAFLDAGHRVVNLSDILVAVWNGLPAKGKGGTADVVDYARRRGIPVKIVWPSDERAL